MNGAGRASALRGGAAIVGVGTAGMGEAPGRSRFELMAEAAQRALGEAGYTLQDVDGLFAITGVDAQPTLSAAEYLGVRPKAMLGTNLGGASVEDYMLWATLALQSGLCKVALVCYGSNQLSAAGRLQSSSNLSDWEAPYEPRYPLSAYALATSRHMHQYGTTREQLAEVAVAAREWARLNPQALRARPADGERRARLAHGVRPADSARLLPGHRWRRGAGDGGATARNDSPSRRSTCWAPASGQPPAGHRHDAGPRPCTAAAAVGPRAFAMAGVAPQRHRRRRALRRLHHHADPVPRGPRLLREGRGWPVRRRTAHRARRPAAGEHQRRRAVLRPPRHVRHVHARSRRSAQLRGEAGERQVPRRQLALCHGNGGTLSSQATVLLGTAATL